MGEQEFWTKGLSHSEYCVHFLNERLFPFVNDFYVSIWDVLTNSPLESVDKTVNAGHSPSHSSLRLRAKHLALRSSFLRSALWKLCTVLIESTRKLIRYSTEHLNIVSWTEGKKSITPNTAFKKLLYIYTHLSWKKIPLAIQKTYWSLRPENGPSS